jgi:putative thioredoxin
VPLARILKDRGETDEALTVLARVPGSFAADGLAARIGLESAARSADVPPVPDLSEAFAALDAGEEERALDLLLEALPNADGARDDVRRVVVGVLDELGVEHPLARSARRRLASALY